MKRLTSLEQNQTISMYFIEAQSEILRDAFARVEKRLGDFEATVRRFHSQPTMWSGLMTFVLLAGRSRSSFTIGFD